MLFLNRFISAVDGRHCPSPTPSIRSSVCSAATYMSVCDTCRSIAEQRARQGLCVICNDPIPYKIYCQQCNKLSIEYSNGLCRSCYYVSRSTVFIHHSRNPLQSPRTPRRPAKEEEKRHPWYSLQKYNQ